MGSFYRHFYLPWWRSQRDIFAQCLLVRKNKGVNGFTVYRLSRFDAVIVVWMRPYSLVWWPDLFDFSKWCHWLLGHVHSSESGWPSGLRRCVQVAVYFCRRGFESHFWQTFFFFLFPICMSAITQYRACPPTTTICYPRHSLYFKNHKINTSCFWISCSCSECASGWWHPLIIRL